MGLTLSFVALAILGLSPSAYAHERWVEHALKSDFDRALFDSVGFVNVGTLVGVMLLAALLLRVSGRVRASRVAPESGLVSKLRPLAPLVLRVTCGLGLILFALQDRFLAPDLRATAGVEGFLLVKTQGVLGVLLVLGLQTRLASLASIGLFIWAMSTRPFLPFDGEPATMIRVLNYVEVVGIEIYLAIVGSGALSLDGRFRRTEESEPSPEIRAQGVGLMRIFLGATLILLGIQKFVLPELPMGVLQNYGDAIYTPIAALTGISPEGYVFSASVIETTVGIFVLAGVFIRPLMIVLALLFVSTLLIFGDDLAGHLPLFGMVFAFLVEGSGSLRLDTFTLPTKREATHVIEDRPVESHA